MFCQRCAPLTRRLSYDPAARPRAELMSGSCIWDDEICQEWCIDCIWKTRVVFHLRYSMTVGETIPLDTQELWQQLEREFPNWPLFRSERRSQEVARQVHWMVKSNSRRA